MGKPKAFKPSQYAAVSDPKADKTFVVMDVVIKNGSTEPYDSTMFYAKATSGDGEVTQVFDSEKGIEMPMATVQPGKQLKFKIVSPSDKGQDFILYVSGDFGIHSEEGVYL